MPADPVRISRWSLRWKQRGARRHLMFSKLQPLLFQTRREAREYASEKFGYIKHRADVRGAPHFWRMPEPVRVKVTLKETQK